MHAPFSMEATMAGQKAYEKADQKGLAMVDQKAFAKADRKVS